ncbi:MAG: radical SAM protein, partial [Ignavibacteriaceae bacterium]|nr:radical SAM protein [Ignavibacteriaceae bacterium]
PFQCIFCNQKKISGQLETPSFDEIRVSIEKHLSTIRKENSEIEIGFFGGNFTGILLDEQEKYLKIANDYLDRGISGIRLSTRPDYINEDVILLLKQYNVTTVELGAQSFDSEVLKKSGRGHTMQDIIYASSMIKNAGIKLGLQMMIGLPGDTIDKSIFTANNIVGLGADNTRLYPALVIKGTALEKLFNDGKYKPLSLSEAVNWTKTILQIFENNNVTILRIGLHPSEGLLNGHELAAGPFHISFKELVLSNIWNDLLSNIEHKTENCDITIEVSKKEFNYAIGYSAQNKKMLQKHFAKVKFIASPLLKNREFNVIYC